MIMAILEAGLQATAMLSQDHSSYAIRQVFLQPNAGGGAANRVACRRSAPVARASLPNATAFLYSLNASEHKNQRLAEDLVSDEVNTFARLPREREGVEWARDGLNSPTSSSKEQSPYGRAVIGRCCRSQASWASPLDAAQLAQSERRAECRVGAAPDPGAGPRTLFRTQHRKSPAFAAKTIARGWGRHYKKAFAILSEPPR